MKKLVKFKWDCGRMGDVESVFITTQEKLEEVYGKRVYFGEILGKHSDIGGTVEENEFTILSEDQEFIKKCLEIFGNETISGHNPLIYFRKWK